MTDYSFIRLTLNDFAKAKSSDNPAISTLNYQGFIVQKPSETFLQISNSSSDISFVGGITVDLVDNCENVVKNINSNFYYEGFVDSNGISQIVFEFGYIGVDYWTKPLYLRITDDINGNKWYSNSFLVTNYLTHISTRFDYTNIGKIYDISYDLAPYTQSVRIANCYDETPINKKEVKQYITSQGLQVNYRPITTFLRKYLINAFDYFVNDRLEVLFSHSMIYANSQRVVVSDFNYDERKSDSNWLSGDFTINPQNEIYSNTAQLFPNLEVTALLPINNVIFSIGQKTSVGNGGFITIFFNMPISLVSGITTKLYKDEVLVAEVVPEISGITTLVSDFSTYFATLANGSYDVIIGSNLVKSVSSFWSGFPLLGQYHFDVVDGEYENTEYNNNEYIVD